MKKNLLILGAGGHGRAVAETARAMRDLEGNSVYEKIDFLDDLKPGAVGKLNDLPVFKKRISGCIPGSWSVSKTDGTVLQGKAIWIYGSSISSSNCLCESIGRDW